MLEEIGYPMELTAEEAWPNFRGLAGELRDQRLPVWPTAWSRLRLRGRGRGPICARARSLLVVHRNEAPGARCSPSHRPDAADVAASQARQPHATRSERPEAAPASSAVGRRARRSGS